MEKNGLNFNETELDLFRRKTGFIFEECIPAEDRMLYAMDEQSGQVFIGNDLLKCNVHSCSSISAVSLEPDGEVCLEFEDAPAIRFRVKGDYAQTIAADIVAKLSGYANIHEKGITEDTVAPALETSHKPAPEQASEADEDDRVIIMSDGVMSRRDILNVVKSLKTGDMIHIEYKPFIGKKRMYDTEFRGMTANVTSKYFSLRSSGKDYAAMMDKTFMELYDNLNLCFLCPDNNSEIEWHLKRIKVLKKI